ncbi:amino acid adenylation domain-containing protein [Micromonospora sp. NPDC047134]|uniref:non-ribosomal peptide synthetase n=1 Tax=Micromonospora sp. NPDC047134 TaxID=3154340 RepID=UPI0033DBCBBE
MTAVAEQVAAFPLSDLQHAYWVGEQGAYELSTPGYLALGWEVAELDVAALQRALARCVARHEMLRVRVLPTGEQIIAEQATVPLHHLSGGIGDREQDWDRLRAETLGVLPDLADGPPLSCGVARSGDRMLVALAVRLFAFDAASVGVLLRDLAAGYRDPDTELPEPRGSYRDFVTRSADPTSRARRADEQYWSTRLADLPDPPDLPTAGGTRPATGDSFERHTWTLDEERTGRLYERARSRGLSVNAVLCTAYAEVVRRWCTQDTFCLNVLVSRRPPTARHADVIGNYGTTVLVAIPPSAGTFAERAAAVQRELHDAYGHSAVSGIEVLRRIRAMRGGAGTLMPVVFTSTIGIGSSSDGTDDDGPFPGARPMPGGMRTPQVWLDHQVYEVGTEIGLNIDVVREVFPPGLVADFLATYQHQLRWLTDPEDTWEQPERPALPAGLLAARMAANRTTRPLPARLLHEGFEQARRRYPDHPAVIGDERTLTYRQLWEAATTLAAGLIREGAEPGDLVGVCADKGWRQVVATLAVLYAGCGYVPLAAGLPAQRAARVLRHAGVRQVLADGRGLATVTTLATGTDPVPGLRCTDLTQALAGASAGVELAVHSHPEDLAYVIYTSGTTGEPKGVAIEHRAAVNTIDDLVDRFTLDTTDRVLALSSLGFDLSVFDIFGTLAVGGAVVLPPEDLAGPDPDAWLDTAARHGVTVWNSVPALLDMALEAGHDPGRLARLRLVMLSGDWIPLDLADRLRAVAPGATVAGLGGATEAAIWSNVHIIDRPLPGWNSVPYGRPLANQGFHVLDGDLDHVPDWVAGDLYITGAGLARGYHREPELTAAAFLRHPRTGERMYRTGDRARYRPDGTLEFLGRIDTQVKIRGFRIELGEIEATLFKAALPAHLTLRSVVVDVHGDRAAQRSLVAFVVPAGPEALSEADRAELVDRLQAAAGQALPTYMVPARFVVLDTLPITGNGKVDRAALRRHAATDLPTVVADPPRPGTEATLARVWQEVLGEPILDRKADFFTCGGTSLLAARLVSRITATLGVRPSLGDLLREPTLAGQAALISDLVRPGGAGHPAAGRPAPASVVTLSGQPGADTLVLFHPVGGGVLCYRQLVATLPAQTHVLGVQAPPPGDRAESVEELVERYVEELSPALGSTPQRLVLAGWSMGGVLAIEAARRLTAAGHRVDRVVAVDSYLAADPEDDSYHHDGDDAVRAFLADLHGGAPGSAPAEIPAELTEAFDRYLLNYRALLRHRPTPPSAEVVLVRCTQRTDAEFPGLRPLDEAWTGTGDPTAGVQVHPVRGDHYSVMTTDLSHLAALLMPDRAG